MKLFLLIVSTLCIEDVYNMKFSHFDRKRDGYLEKSYGSDNDDVNEYERWFQQDLDHFNPDDKRTWPQRYFVNDKLSDKSRNVVFLLIEGEGEIFPEQIEHGSWIEYAKHFKALCFCLEHRFYGASHPTPDTSLENLQYLSSKQALVDLAFFIKSMNIEYNLSPDVKWIAFGSSYAGTLAGWLRQSYPYLLHGAVSSSAGFLAKLNYEEFYKNVADILRDHSAECLTALSTGIYQAEGLLEIEGGDDVLENLFNLCFPLDNSTNRAKDISCLFGKLALYIGEIVQYSNFCPDHNIKVSIDTLCEIMTDQEIQPEVGRLSVLFDFLLNAYGFSCLGFNFDYLINNLKKTNWNDSVVHSGQRQWRYQKCTELGIETTTDYEPQLLGDKCPIEYSVSICEAAFGPKYNHRFMQNAVDNMNAYYGGLKIKVSNVVFVEGSVDPWKSLGITEPLGKGSSAIIIEGTSHGADGCPSSEKDNASLKAARAKIKNLIGSWLDLE